MIALQLAQTKFVLLEFSLQQLFAHWTQSSWKVSLVSFHLSFVNFFNSYVILLASPSRIRMQTFLSVLTSAAMFCFFSNPSSPEIHQLLGPPVVFEFRFTRKGLELMIYQLFYGCRAIRTQHAKIGTCLNGSSRIIYIWPQFLTLHLTFLIIQGTLYLFPSIFG